MAEAVALSPAGHGLQVEVGGEGEAERLVVAQGRGCDRRRHRSPGVPVPPAPVGVRRQPPPGGPGAEAQHVRVCGRAPEGPPLGRAVGAHTHEVARGAGVEEAARAGEVPPRHWARGGLQRHVEDARARRQRRRGGVRPALWQRQRRGSDREGRWGQRDAQQRRGSPVRAHQPQGAGCVREAPEAVEGREGVAQRRAPKARPAVQAFHPTFRAGRDAQARRRVRQDRDVRRGGEEGQRVVRPEGPGLGVEGLDAEAVVLGLAGDDDAGAGGGDGEDGPAGVGGVGEGGQAWAGGAWRARTQGGGGGGGGGGLRHAVQQQAGRRHRQPPGSIPDRHHLHRGGVPGTVEAEGAREGRGRAVEVGAAVGAGQVAVGPGPAVGAGGAAVAVPVAPERVRRARWGPCARRRRQRDDVAAGALVRGVTAAEERTGDAGAVPRAHATVRRWAGGDGTGGAPLPDERRREGPGIHPRVGHKPREDLVGGVGGVDVECGPRADVDRQRQAPRGSVAVDVQLQDALLHDAHDMVPQMREDCGPH